VVYASRGTIAAYRKDGHFPDGTFLVTEVFKTTTKQRVPDLTDRGLAPSEPKAVGARASIGQARAGPNRRARSIRSAATQKTEPAKLLAVFVLDTNDNPLTTPIK
jgi:hypothetical protein